MRPRVRERDCYPARRFRGMKYSSGIRANKKRTRTKTEDERNRCGATGAQLGQLSRRVVRRDTRYQ